MELPVVVVVLLPNCLQPAHNPRQWGFISDLLEGAISIFKRVCLILFLSGSIVSVGDPKKKYTRFEKIGQG